MRVKGAPRREGVDSRPYFLIHTPFIPIVPLGILPGGFFFLLSARRTLKVLWITGP